MYPKFAFQTDQISSEGVVGLKYPEIFAPHFCWAIVGTPGSGKTTFIQNLLKENDMYKDKFEYIFVISPSNIKIDGIDQECCTNKLNVQWIYERINYLQEQNIKNANLLIIMDDCISQIKSIFQQATYLEKQHDQHHIDDSIIYNGSSSVPIGL